MTEITAFIASITQITNIAKALFQARDEAKRTELLIDLNGALADAQTKHLAVIQDYQKLLEANEALKKQLAANEWWEQECARYTLQPIEPGIFAYRLKPGDALGEPDHWLCAACHKNREVSILQRSSKGSNLLNCPRHPDHALNLEEYA